MDRSSKRRPAQPQEEESSPSSKVPRSSPSESPSIRKSGRDRRRSVRVPDDFSLPSYASAKKEPENTKKCTDKNPGKAQKKGNSSQISKKSPALKETPRAQRAKGNNDELAEEIDDKLESHPNVKSSKHLGRSGSCEDVKSDSQSYKIVAGQKEIEKTNSSCFAGKSSENTDKANKEKEETNAGPKDSHSVTPEVPQKRVSSASKGESSSREETSLHLQSPQTPSSSPLPSKIPESSPSTSDPPKPSPGTKVPGDDLGDSEVHGDNLREEESTIETPKHNGSSTAQKGLSQTDACNTSPALTQNVSVRQENYRKTNTTVSNEKVEVQSLLYPDYIVKTGVTSALQSGRVSSPVSLSQAAAYMNSISKKDPNLDPTADAKKNAHSRPFRPSILTPIKPRTVTVPPVQDPSTKPLVYVVKGVMQNKAIAVAEDHQDILSVKKTPQPKQGSVAAQGNQLDKDKQDKRVMSVIDFSRKSGSRECALIINTEALGSSTKSQSVVAPVLPAQSKSVPSTSNPTATSNSGIAIEVAKEQLTSTTTKASPGGYVSLDQNVLSALEKIPPLEGHPPPESLQQHDCYKSILQSLEIGQKYIEPVQNELFHVVAATVSPTLLRGLHSPAMRYKVLNLISAGSGAKTIFLPGQTLMVGTAEQMMIARLIMDAMMTHSKDNQDNPECDLPVTVSESDVLSAANSAASKTLHPAKPGNKSKTKPKPAKSRQVISNESQTSANVNKYAQPNSGNNTPITSEPQEVVHVILGSETEVADVRTDELADDQNENDPDMVKMIEMTEEGVVDVTWVKIKNEDVSKNESLEEVCEEEFLHDISGEEGSTLVKTETSPAEGEVKEEGQQESDGEYYPDDVTEVAFVNKPKAATAQPKEYSPGSLQMKMKPGRSLCTLNPVRATNTCNLCGFKSSVDGIRKHMRRFHAKTTFMCPDCGKRFALPNDLKRHYKLHGKDTVLTNEVMKQHVFCEECGFQGSDVSVMQHISEMHVAEVVCSLCRRICESPEDLDRHIKKYHSQEAKEIKAIQEASRSLLSLGGIGRRGRKGKNPSHQYKCIWCGTMFSQEATLRYHLKVRHIDVQHHKCKICGKIYMDERVLKVHVRRLHLKEKRFFCEICNKGFFEKRQLVRHRGTHINGSANQSYMCAFCGLHFTQQSHLRSHEKMHSERPTDDREVAGMGGATNTGMSAAGDPKSVPSGMMACGICHRSYRYRRSLYYHIRKGHGMDPRHVAVLTTPSDALPDIQLQQPGGEMTNLEEISKEAQRSVEMVFRDLGVEGHGGDAMIVEATQEEVEDEDSVVVYMCEVCQVLFTDMQELNKHFASAHPEVPMNLDKGDEENREEAAKAASNIPVESCDSEVVSYEVVVSD